jgi:hypothetical protein
VAFAIALFGARRRGSVRRLYERKLEAALEDGTLSPDELAELDSFRAEKELTDAEVRMIARTIYRRALRDALADDALSDEEDEALLRLQTQLGLSNADIGGDFVQLSRLRLLARVQTGDLPIVEPTISLVPQERCHWVVQCTFAERIGLPGTGPRGVRMSVTGSEPFSAHGTREELRPNDAILPVDPGTVVVTSRRTVFRGAKRTVSIPHARLDQVVLFGDGLRLDELGGKARGYLLVDDAELTVAVLLQAARTRREEIRPVRPGRTA